MEGEVVDEAGLVRLPERELVDDSLGVTQERARANDQVALRELPEHGVVKVQFQNFVAGTAEKKAIT